MRRWRPASGPASTLTVIRDAAKPPSGVLGRNEEKHATHHAQTMLAVLGQQDTLRVFAAMVTSTGTGEPHAIADANTVTPITPTGAAKATGLPLDRVTTALRRLESAGLDRRDRQDG